MGHLLLTEEPRIARIRLDQIQVPVSEFRMDENHVLALADALRHGSCDAPPVLLAELGADSGYALKDGRHRFVASMLAGRVDILAVVGTQFTETA